MIPETKKNAHYSLRVPALSGGINKRDGKNLIGDSQLTEAKNMWYSDGLLKTRPRLRFGLDAAVVSSPEAEDIESSFSVNEINEVVINGKRYALEITVNSRKSYTEGTEYKENVSLRYVHSLEDNIFLGRFFTESASTIGLTCMAITHKGDIYCYVRYWSLPEECNKYEIWKIRRLGEGEYGAPERVSENDIYAPLVLINCVSSAGETVERNIPLRNSVQVEGFNLIGSRYRMLFSTYDITADACHFDEDSTYMQYALPYTAATTKDMPDIIVTYTDIRGNEYTHTVQRPNGYVTSTVEDECGEDGLYLHAFIENGICQISFNAMGDVDSSAPCTISSKEYLNNNMEVNAPCYNAPENWDKVMTMAQGVWYGSTSLGLNGGSRLFLGASSEESEKALVVWSDFENPLYFSENNYAYVGDKAQAVTAFGRQGASLIIFKEREIYSTQYTQGEVTADELAEQTVIDITTRLAYFPMVQIHPGIGCDCPYTVALCRNRLVWASTCGKVYTLTAQNQYSERNVFEISEMVESMLKEEELKHAQGVDYLGRYMLFAKNAVYVMDYNSYGYVNISAYNKNNDANMLISWQYWCIGDETAGVLSIGDRLLVRARVFNDSTGGERNEAYVLGEFTEECRSDEICLCKRENGELKTEFAERAVESDFTTKLFDFEDPTKNKKVLKAGLVFANNGVVPMTLGFVNDAGFLDESSIKLEEKADADLFSLLKAIYRRPYFQITGRMGISVRAQGPLAVASMVLEYKTVGESR